MGAGLGEKKRMQPMTRKNQTKWSIKIEELKEKIEKP